MQGERPAAGGATRATAMGRGSHVVSAGWGDEAAIAPAQPDTPQGPTTVDQGHSLAGGGGRTLRFEGAGGEGRGGLGPGAGFVARFDSDEEDEDDDDEFGAVDSPPQGLYARRGQRGGAGRRVAGGGGRPAVGGTGTDHHGLDVERERSALLSVLGGEMFDELWSAEPQGDGGLDHELAGLLGPRLGQSPESPSVRELAHRMASLKVAYLMS